MEAKASSSKARRELLSSLLAIERERLNRRRDDPLALFEPHAKQKPFIDDIMANDKQEYWFLAANRAGKSLVGAYCGAHLARLGDPSARYQNLGGGLQVRDKATSGWVISPDFKTSQETIQTKYFDNGFVPPGGERPFIPDREIAEWRVADQILKLRNGSLIFFRNCTMQRTAFQGGEKDWIHYDEEPKKNIYEECIIRIGTRRLRVFGTCTLLPPEGQVGGVSWVFADRVEPWREGKMPEVGIYTASIYDNPKLPPEEIKKMEALYPPGSIQRRIRLNGELLPGLSGARAYTHFDRQLHVRPQPVIADRVPLVWTWDFNVEPMVSLVLQKRGPIWAVHKEIVLDEGSIPDMCERFRSVYPGHGAEIYVYGDATGGNRTSQTGVSNYNIIMNCMQGYSSPIRLKVPEANPPQVDRINAVNMILKDENGMIGMEIDPSCEELIRDLEGVLRDPYGGIKKTRNRNDPYFRRSHTSDSLGYMVHQERPVRSTANVRRTGKVTIKNPSYGFASGGKSV